jgi:DNA-3-methyladenine glycosylase II
MKETKFTLRVVEPFRLDFTVWALRRRAVNRIDRWDEKSYTRVLLIDGHPVKLEVLKQTQGKVHVTVTSHDTISELKPKVEKLLIGMLGLKVDLSEFYARAKKETHLKKLVEEFRGVKPPKFSSLFETFVNAIACQQLSLEAGLSLLNKFTERFGKKFAEKKEVFFAFPEPNSIMRCKPYQLRKLGFSFHKSEALISLAKEMVKHPEKFHQLENLSDEELISFFCSLKGIGRWSAEYVLLRGLGHTEVLPGDDIAVHKKIKKLLCLRKNPTYETIKAVEKKWYPFAGLIYFHLLLKGLKSEDTWQKEL